MSERSLLAWAEAGYGYCAVCGEEFTIDSTQEALEALCDTHYAELEAYA